MIKFIASAVLATTITVVGLGANTAQAQQCRPATVCTLPGGGVKIIPPAPAVSVERPKFSRPVAKPAVHAPRVTGSGWMGQQGFRTCSSVRASCVRGLVKKGAHHHMYRCGERFTACIQTGCWRTNSEGHACGLARR